MEKIECKSIAFGLFFVGEKGYNKEKTFQEKKNGRKTKFAE